MQGLKDLERSIGLTYDQLRTRVAHLSASFEGVYVEGRRGKWLVTDRGFALLRRLRELEDDGHSFDSATAVIKDELENDRQNGDNAEPTEDRTATAETPRSVNDPLVADAFDALKAQLQQKDEEIAWLRGLVEDQREEIKALGPGRSDSETYPNANGMTRWQHFKKAVFGG